MRHQKNQLDYNMQRKIKLSNEYSREFSKVFNLEGKSFLISVKKMENEISISCNPNNEDEEITSLIEYYLELTYDKFLNLGKSFKQCDDSNQVYNLLYKVLKSEIKFSDGMKSNSNLKYSKNSSIILNMEIPLLSGNYEKLKIELMQREKDIKKQFSRLKEKYLKLKEEFNDRNNGLGFERGLRKEYNEKENYNTDWL